MDIQHRAVVYDATQQPRNRSIAYFTTLYKLRSGVLLCGFQVGPAKHAPDCTVGICRSTNGGTSWEQIPATLATTFNNTPGSLSAPAFYEAPSGRLALFASWFDRSEPDRPLFDPVTEGILRSKMVVAFSDDGGQSWTPWQVIDTHGLTGCAGTGPVVEWSDGTVAMAFESFKEFDDPKPARHGAWIVVSRDHGATFSAPVLVAQDPQNQVYYWDQRLCPTGPDGQFMGLFWTHDRSQERDLQVHLRHSCLQAETIQGDQIIQTPIRGQIAAPLMLSDGRLLCFVVDRNRPGTLKLWVSHDQGKTWPDREVLIVHTHDEQAALAQKSERIDFAQYWEDMGKWSFGHPALLPLDQDHVLAAYYAGTPDRMSIHACKIALNHGIHLQEPK